ncbi:hypothetical protein, partial [Verrucomicrobium spinosum]|uniref:hypothetical protein n=1 Tax=Verrucomicrobium spinosum TaxID=2736 RepID=UPI000AC096EC
HPRAHRWHHLPHPATSKPVLQTDVTKYIGWALLITGGVLMASLATGLATPLLASSASPSPSSASSSASWPQNHEPRKPVSNPLKAP